MTCPSDRRADGVEVGRGLNDGVADSTPGLSAQSGLLRVTSLTSSRLAPNPGPMTLDGTNSYVIAGPGSPSTVVVDPGPLDDRHLRELAARPVELILITHHHLDHTEAAAAFHSLTGAPVRALDPAFCIGGERLVDGEVIHAAGTRIRVLATPGHTADSVCFVLPDDLLGAAVLGDDRVAPAVDEAGTSADAGGSVLTGDTILGRGTTVIAHPDGNLADYLASLGLLAALGPMIVLPAHGPTRPDVGALATEYRAHREHRLDQVRQAVAELSAAASPVTAAAVADLVYVDIDPSVRAAAERSVAAQLSYLAMPPGDSR